MNEQNAKAGLETLEGLMGNTQKVLKNLMSENKQLRETVEYYADPEHWRANLKNISRCDRGERAREFLKSLKKPGITKPRICE